MPAEQLRNDKEKKKSFPQLQHLHLLGIQESTWEAELFFGV